MTTSRGPAPRLPRFLREVPTVGLLVASNLIPLAGVALWGWHLGTVMVLYWLENGIVGVLNIPRMALAALAAEERSGLTPASGADFVRLLRVAGRMSMIPFFIAHYGIFWVVHGVFVFALFAGAEPFGKAATSASATATAGVDPLAVATGAVGLALYHIVAFAYWDVYRGEARRQTLDDVMFSPYPRLVVLHVTIIVGAILVAETGQPIAALALLVILKTVIDLGGHAFAHRARPASPPPGIVTRLDRLRRR
jgi:hypothetical protein